jgi:hypothetical protein
MTTSKAKNTFGSIETSPAGKGFVRIDACVPSAKGYAMLALALKNPAVRVCSAFQAEVGGSFLLDVKAPFAVAEKMVAIAKRGGLSNRAA